MTRVYILLGSNLEAESNLRRAVTLLAEQLTIVGVSPVFESVPVGYAAQPCFLNAIIAIQTDLAPNRLRSTVLAPVETALGRVRTGNKYGPRTIDLDIILYGERILFCGGRRVPHGDLLRYAHVAYPMARLAPDLRHPETGETMEEIATRLHADFIRERNDILLAAESGDKKGKA